MRILKECRRKKCRKLFGAVYGFNIFKDKKGNLKATCPWCEHNNLLNRREMRQISIKKLKE